MAKKNAHTSNCLAEAKANYTEACAAWERAKESVRAAEAVPHEQPKKQNPGDRLPPWDVEKLRARVVLEQAKIDCNAARYAFGIAEEKYEAALFAEEIATGDADATSVAPLQIIADIEARRAEERAALEAYELAYERAKAAIFEQRKASLAALERLNAKRASAGQPAHELHADVANANLDTDQVVAELRRAATREPASFDRSFNPARGFDLYELTQQLERCEEELARKERDRADGEARYEAQQREKAARAEAEREAWREKVAAEEARQKAAVERARRGLPEGAR